MTTDPFIEALEREQEPDECALCAVLAEMPEERAIATRRALNSRMGNERIAKIFRQHDIRAGRPTIATHRREGHQ